jgi:DNA-binding MarR family transcriptional regulator
VSAGAERPSTVELSNGEIIDAINRSRRTANERHILRAILDYYTATQRYAYPGAALLGEHTALHPDTVESTIRRLSVDGWIALKKITAPMGGRVNKYTITPVASELRSRDDIAAAVAAHREEERVTRDRRRSAKRSRAAVPGPAQGTREPLSPIGEARVPGPWRLSPRSWTGGSGSGSFRRS